ncbi:MAG: triose-phosphate isomerase [Francisellaceae bacterium]
MRKQIIMGNWKMNGSFRFAKDLSESLNQVAGSVDYADIAVCVATPYLAFVGNNLKGIALGAQNISEYNDGAYTGETSGAMLSDCGVDYVLVGHSERRALFHETSHQVAKKALKAIEHGMIAVVCIGETLDERKSGQLHEVLSQQIAPLFDLLTHNELERLIIAYEPVWAIGTGLSATAKEVQEVHRFIRQIFAKFNENLANSLKIVYGGSLKPSNAKEILSLDDVDGGLIGGASLKAKDFGEIIKNAKR